MGYALLRTKNADVIMKTMMAACLGVLLVGCQTSQPLTHRLVYSGGDGSSCQRAVVIGGANCREAGSLAISQWLEQSYPDAQGKRISTMNSAGRHYDLVAFTTTKGEGQTVYFDTTDCFGK
jgi:hypothetical protein